MSAEPCTSVPTVKICGLQSVEVLKSMINLPVDQVGFVFATSKRQVRADQVAEMISFIRAQDTFRPVTVGVFVNPQLDELIDLLKIAPLDVVQLHGQESAEFCQAVKTQCAVQIYKCHSLRESSNPDSVSDSWDAYRDVIDALILDSYDPVYIGGSGKTFPWERIAPYQKWAKEAGIPLIIAGGLHPGNVHELLDRIHPDGVDVSSGVETDGVKDIVKITAFVERVKQQ
ncbi:N-(5'-phosphoribosyl)anthranilate isomerase [Paenibacillus selenitireducens]|uniref:N-(5'-phosphoribosyl)anthranilate isomerase n=1 Tax=Paenibacillus selenitireducens TaxID=1324314 RepID=A0A1T2XNQ5_9BACL|nr:phosphoribosylanthranilate isomerase [Paenibacillus selenitireducens]OPA81452.1 N-(5'-phosphoribosyl)anthranilate isomerase [Paenibacillus selenitireducens]